MKREQGFTLIELMIVVAIIAILAAIALPAYQDYVARSQVTEATSLSTGAKLAITTYYADHGGFPADNAEAGMADPADISGKYVQSLTVSAGGLVTVEFDPAEASAKISGTPFTLQADDTSGGSLVWECGGVDPKYLPSSCR